MVGGNQIYQYILGWWEKEIIGDGRFKSLIKLQNRSRSLEIGRLGHFMMSHGDMPVNPVRMKTTARLTRHIKSMKKGFPN